MTIALAKRALIGLIPVLAVLFAGCAASGSSDNSVPGGGLLTCKTLPAAPAGLSASSVTSTGFNLSWTAPSAGTNCTVSGYVVYQGGTQVATPSGLDVSLSGLTPGTYAYTVAARNAKGTGPVSSVLTVILPATSSPDWFTEFAANGGQWDTRHQAAGGSVAFGAPDAGAGDGKSVALTFLGDPTLGSGDRTSPDYATEISSTQTFLYGIFRARLRLATCSSNEEVVNGFFTFFNDGSDLNNDGMADNSEIDIEILCGTPRFISLTSWTQYKSDSAFVSWNRTIDTSTGDYVESVNDHSYDEAYAGNSPAFKIPGFPNANTYYEMGFEWRVDRLRFFIMVDGADVTLWDYRDAAHIPTRAGNLLFNVWHSADHWFDPGGAADYPANDAVMRVDWARHWS